MKKYIFSILMAGLVLACGESAEQARTYFIEPEDGATVTSPVRVLMGVEGMEVVPAGDPVEGTGHHHILINHEPMAEGENIPFDEVHKHFGGGETEASLELEPGDYQLTLQFADGLHRSYGPELASTIHITVIDEEEAMEDEDIAESEEADADDAAESEPAEDTE